jgi:predicted transcriptional regulator
VPSKSRLPLAAGNCHHVAAEVTMTGKRVQLDDETWHALDLLAKDRMQTFQELADEAFADLLLKHGRPTDLKTALRQRVTGMDKRPPAASVKRGARKKAASNDNG